MTNEPRAVREIHAIREKIYEETKHLTREERIKRINDKGQRLAAEFGFTIVPSANKDIEKRQG